MSVIFVIAVAPAPHPPAGTFSPQAGRREMAATPAPPLPAVSHHARKAAVLSVHALKRRGRDPARAARANHDRRTGRQRRDGRLIQPFDRAPAAATGCG